MLPRVDRTVVLQLRSKSQDSSSSKNKESKQSATAIANASPPPPPPNSAKPLPQLSSAVASLNHVNSSSHSLSSANGSVSRASTAALSSQGSDRRYGVDRASPAPPIVVVSPEAPPDALERQPFVVESSGGPTTPPRANLNRLRPTGPKDTIPMVGKPPRKQRSSRFVVNERVEIERLPPFLGMWCIHRLGADV